MSMKRRILAAILVFAALGYLVAYTIFTHPYFAASNGSPSNQRVSGGSNHLAGGALPRTDGAGQLATQAQTQVTSAAASLANDLPEPTSQSELNDGAPSAVQSTIDALSNPDSLHSALAGSLMAERNFDDLIRGLQKTSPQSYERQARLLDNINRLDPVLDNSLRLRVLNCNEVFCGASFNYDNEDVVLEFMGAFLATSSESGAMAIQPVMIDDIPQLRMIIHRSASYQVD